MDLFQRRRGEWVYKIKAEASAQSSALQQQKHHPASTPAEEVDTEEKKKSKTKSKWKNKALKKDEKSSNVQDAREGKSAIQLAREKFAAAKAAKAAGVTSSRPSFKSANAKGKGTGANAT